MKTNEFSWDPVWNQVFKEQEWGKYPSESLIRFIARNFYRRSRKEISLLEVGCGPGANIWYMAREGFNVSGVDGSEVAINKAKERLKKSNLDANLLVADLMNLPFENDSFDGVVDAECLYANSELNTKQILSEIKRVMKTGSLFYSRTFSNKMFIGRQSSIKNEFEYTDIDEGPLRGKGFTRLINRRKISDLYGGFFEIISVDKLEYTQYNGKQLISEYEIISKKL